MLRECYTKCFKAYIIRTVPYFTGLREVCDFVKTVNCITVNLDSINRKYIPMVKSQPENSFG